MADTPASIACEDGVKLAFHHNPGYTPGVIFCTGFRSDMTGGKAVSLGAFCCDRGQQYTRFDYRGQGQSGGFFADSTIGDWLKDALTILDSIATGPQIVVGSSMGGWIAFLLARARPNRIAAIITIAPAVAMTQRTLANLPNDAKQQLEEKGVWIRPSRYEPAGYPITQKLLQEGINHNLLGDPIKFEGPVRILHGMQDDAVPWSLSLDILDALVSPDVKITFVKDADHRMSRPDDIKRLLNFVDALS